MSVLNAPIGNRSVSSDHAYILEDLHLLSCPFHLLCFSSTRPFQKFPSSVLSTSDLHSLDARLFQLFRLFHPPTTSSFLDRVFRHSLYPPNYPSHQSCLSRRLCLPPCFSPRTRKPLWDMSERGSHITLVTRYSSPFFSGHPSLFKTRLDPIVSPGLVSGHVHSFGGASTIYKDLTYDGLRSSNCTTSDMADDKSVSSGGDEEGLALIPL
jgi:hypothetical protein